MSQLNTSFWENGAARQWDQICFESDAQDRYDEQVQERASQLIANERFGDKYEDQRRDVFVHIYLFEKHKDYWEDILNHLTLSDIKDAQAEFEKRCYEVADDELMAEAYASKYEDAYYHD